MKVINDAAEGLSSIQTTLPYYSTILCNEPVFCKQ